MRVVVSLLLLALALGGSAAPPESLSQATTTPQTQSARARAALFALNETEWLRYETLMSGPQGLRTPNLDPIVVLGIHARDDAERARYAKRYMQAEIARAEMELIFAQTYAEIFEQEHGGQPLMALPSTPESVLPSPPNSMDRLAAVLFLPCPECEQPAALQLIRENALPVDLYFVVEPALGADATIRQWAQRTAIDTGLIESGRLTLNLADSLLPQLDRAGLKPNGAMTWYARSGDALRPLAPIELLRLGVQP